jgi:hypothetical protein
MIHEMQNIIDHYLGGRQTGMISDWLSLVVLRLREKV